MPASKDSEDWHIGNAQPMAAATATAAINLTSKMSCSFVCSFP